MSDEAGLVSDDERYTGEEEPRGYPRDTPVKDMEPQEAAAFWKHHAYLERKARAKDNRSNEDRLAELTRRLESAPGRGEPEREEPERAAPEQEDDSERKTPEREEPERKAPEQEDGSERRAPGREDDSERKTPGREEPERKAPGREDDSERVSRYLVTSGFRAAGVSAEDTRKLSEFIDVGSFLGEDGLPDDERIERFVELVSVSGAGSVESSATLGSRAFPRSDAESSDIDYWMRKYKSKD